MQTVVANEKAIDWPRSIPFVAVHVAALVGVVVLGWSWRGFGLAVALYYARMFFVTAGYHRYFSHRSFRTSRAMQLVLALGAMSSSQKGVLWWAGHHRTHHRFSDQAGDMHSALRDGFLWSHVGWILSHKHQPTDTAHVKDLAKYPELVWLDRWWWLPPTALAVGLFLAGSPFAFVWGFFVSTALLWHGTFTINSLTHMFGRRRYATTDNSRNSATLAIVTLGEGWHDNHHYYPRCVRQGFLWWEIDPTYLVLRVMAAFGLVWDVHEPPEEVVAGLRPIPGGMLAPMQAQDVRRWIVGTGQRSRLTGLTRWPIEVGREWDRRLRPELRNDSRRLVAGEHVTRGIQTVRSFFERVVTSEDLAEGRQPRQGWRPRQQSRDLTMISSQLCGDLQWRTSASCARERQENLLLHADVAEEIVSEMCVRGFVDDTVRGLARSKEVVDAGVVLDHEPFDVADRHVHDLVPGRMQRTSLQRVSCYCGIPPRQCARLAPTRSIGGAPSSHGHGERPAWGSGLADKSSARVGNADCPDIVQIDNAARTARSVKRSGANTGAPKTTCAVIDGAGRRKSVSRCNTNPTIPTMASSPHTPRHTRNMSGSFRTSATPKKLHANADAKTGIHSVFSKKLFWA
ncbi:acyl-CoA desaturase [Pendulispora brunnea]|uniref:Acyl-CoA desaturase n=1 Tax=Pendulispora brunnea TaxID=2905690 RepID=A0ABZ2JZ46_9BACT